MHQAVLPLGPFRLNSLHIAAMPHVQAQKRTKAAIHSPGAQVERGALIPGSRLQCKAAAKGETKGSKAGRSSESSRRKVHLEERAQELLSGVPLDQFKQFGGRWAHANARALFVFTGTCIQRGVGRVEIGERAGCTSGGRLQKGRSASRLYS
eukprot:1160686-Pelagomonas_calceolata.AAC.4